MTGRSSAGTNIPAPVQDVVPVDVSVRLGLASRGTELQLPAGSRCLDLNPWLLDCVGARVQCMGHQDELPRSWDWENVLTLLEPGEELVYALDHVESDGVQTGAPFTLWIALRFPRTVAVGVGTMNHRAQRARLLFSQFQRQAFPGSELEWVDPSELHQLLDFAAGGQRRSICVSGRPSPRLAAAEGEEVDRTNAGSRNYQSLNDVAESLVDVCCDYRIAFVVKRVSDHELRDALHWSTTLRDQLHPLVRTSVQAGQTVGVSASSQVSTTEGGNESSQSSTGGQGGWNLIVKNWSNNSSEGSTKGTNWSHTEGTTSGTTASSTVNATRESLRSSLDLADRSLERTIESLYEAHGTGGYQWAAWVFANGNDADLVAGTLGGVLAGPGTKDHPLNRVVVEGLGVEVLHSSLSLIEPVSAAAPILPLPRACDALLLPEAELPGVRLRRNVFLGRTCSPPGAPGQPTIALGPDAFGAVASPDHQSQVRLRRSDLFRHILVAGSTGSGKTTRVVEILNGLEDDQLSLLVLETAKSTYRGLLQRAGRPAPTILTLGGVGGQQGSRVRPLRLNPFYFELGTSLKRHIAVLSDALAELMPTEAMIGPLMRRAVEDAYRERGWDIERGVPLDSEIPTWPTVLDFAAQVRSLAANLNYGPEVTANYRGALESRASLFMDAIHEDIFSHGGNTPIDVLCPPGHDVIIEVEHLPPSEVDIRAFVMTLLLSRLRSTQAVRKRAVLPPSAADLAPEVEEQRLAAVIEYSLSDLGSRRARRNEVRRLLKEGLVSISGSVTRKDSIVGPADLVCVGGKQIWPVSTENGAQAAGKSGGQVAQCRRSWLVVLEEAHNVLERSFEERRPADESNAGRTLLRGVNRLLQEGREMEIALLVIDQEPSSLARSVISNTGTKVIMRLEDGAEMEEMGRAIGLDPDAWPKLGFLQEGEGIVKAPYMDAPVKTARFPQLSGRPPVDEAMSGGWIPSYRRLEALWSPVFAGTSPPDESWCKELAGCAGGSAELALFSGVKLLMRDPADGKNEASRARPFRDLLADSRLDFRRVQDAAKIIHRDAIREWEGSAALGIERLMFRALAQYAAPERPPLVPVTAEAIRRTASRLESGGLGDASRWSALLARLAQPGGSWMPRSQQLIAYASEVGRGDPFAVLRSMVVMRSESTEHPSFVKATRPQADVLDLMLSIGRLVEPIVAGRAAGATDREEAVRIGAIIERFERMLGLDIARRYCGEALVAELERLGAE